MIRVDKNHIPAVGNEIRLFAVMRNESVRLRFWLDHYRGIGVNRFFVVDNASSDDTAEILLNQPDVHLYSSDEDFQLSQSGRLWLLALMAEHGVGYWCLVADADELLAYPHWETVRLQTLSRALDAQGHDVLECLLLDMYSSAPVCETDYSAGVDPFTICPWFDPDFTPVRGAVDHDDGSLVISTYVGSTRRKSFGIDAFLSKIALMRYRPEMLLTRGQHGILRGRVSPLRGVMFHFKYLSDFPKNVENVIRQEERANCSDEWRAYHHAFRLNPRLSLHDHRSEKYANSEQLIQMGLMKSDDLYDEYILGKKY